MKTVKQRGTRDCGAACIAMLASVSYERGFGALYGHKEPYATKTEHIRKALRKLGFRTSRKRVSLFGRRHSEVRLPFNALIYCNYRTAADEAHWIVWDARARKFRDPLRRPYKRPRVHSYLKVFR